jgi:hypothetical protein
MILNKQKLILFELLLPLTLFVQPASVSAQGQVVPKVTGTFCFQASYGSNVQNFQACVVLTAQQLDADGNGKGSLTYTDPNGTFVVEVSYLKVVGNKGYLAGAVAYSDFPGVTEGTWFYEVATDNGDPGIGRDTLAGSNWGTNDGATAKACAEAPGSCRNQTADLSITSGNIQVFPKP